MKVNNSLKEAIDNYGDDHVGSSATTPLRADAFELSNSDKIDQIEEKVAEILEILGMD
jgi:GTP cyclohydrolase I